MEVTELTEKLGCTKVTPNLIHYDNIVPTPLGPPTHIKKRKGRIMKIVLAVMALFAIIMLAGCEQKPGYMIEGYLTSDYYKEGNCVYFIPDRGCGKSVEMEACGDYEIRPVNGAKLKKPIKVNEYGY